MSEMAQGESGDKTTQLEYHKAMPTHRSCLHILFRRQKRRPYSKMPKRGPGVLTQKHRDDLSQHPLGISSPTPPQGRAGTPMSQIREVNFPGVEPPVPRHLDRKRQSP